ncbi:hypothetical protein OSB04_028657 [Centaurea solstitialis]|uniref:Uncharacterized protein n=1 Tax=Centaurea solstitialis TaxID=347529 RepID=A0AA38WBE3_9ASTR|nr:hypothetical protein OSB04_028657 [Centaurea solstitialis]
MLAKFELTTCSEMGTPMAPPLKLDKDSSRKSVDVTLYRGMIGSLMYLTASRPDIMYATCLCARYQADPKESHMKADILATEDVADIPVYADVPAAPSHKKAAAKKKGPQMKLTFKRPSPSSSSQIQQEGQAGLSVGYLATKRAFLGGQEPREIADKKAALNASEVKTAEIYQQKHDDKVLLVNQAQAEAKAAAALEKAQTKSLKKASSSSPDLGMFLSIPALGSINGKIEVLAQAIGILGNSMDELRDHLIPEIQVSVKKGPDSLPLFQAKVSRRLDAQDKAIKGIQDQLNELKAQVAAISPPPAPAAPSFTERDRSLLESMAASMICHSRVQTKMVSLLTRCISVSA